MDYLFALVTLILISHHLRNPSLVEAKTHGFSVELIHRDSQLSPFYNHSATHGELSRQDAIRSIARINHFSSSSLDDEKIQSLIIPNGGNYLMKFSIGSPPIENLAIADTGSDLIWFQCEPCLDCYPQNSPIFDPKKSSTYMELTCDSTPCDSLPRRTCGSTNNECLYSYAYGDRSHTRGVLATDTFSFDSINGQVATFQNSIFGCGHQNGGTFNERGAGLVGLGGGRLSLISQLSDAIEKKFSYCLLPRTVNSSSKLKFGINAFISSGDVVSTPIVSKDQDTFYYLTLEAITIGNKRILNSQTSLGDGNIVIDSGTTLTILESNFYGELEAAVKESIGLNPVQDSEGTLKLCYDRTSFSEIPESERRLIFHFTGADVTLTTLNTFIELDDITCLAIYPSDSFSIYGNIAQINFQVEYDLAKKQVSFAAADCTKS